MIISHQLKTKSLENVNKSLNGDFIHFLAPLWQVTLASSKASAGNLLSKEDKTNAFSSLEALTIGQKLGSFAIAQNPHFLAHFRSKALLVNSIQKSLDFCWYLIIWFFYEIVLCFVFTRNCLQKSFSQYVMMNVKKNAEAWKKSMFFLTVYILK